MVAVGVTGHRNFSNPEGVALAVDEALEKIIISFGGSSLTVISPLAEGADRLVAERAMENYMARLIVPLPLEIDDYLKDFSSETSKQAFRQLLQKAISIIDLPSQDIRAASYLSAGMYTLEHCDVLLAIWDGQPARGIGGTGQIFAEAREQGKPLVWIEVDRSGQRDDAKPKIYYERFPTLGTKAG